MSVLDVCLVRSKGSSGEPVLRLGVRVLDDYLDFVAGRCRPNTVLATAYDLRVFVTVVAKAPEEVTSRDVLAFMTAQRAGRPRIGGPGTTPLVAVAAGDTSGVSNRTLRRRLSSISGLYSYLVARGDIAANPVPRGLPTRRERNRPHQGVPLVPLDPHGPADPDSGRGRQAHCRATHPPGPGDDRGDGPRWAASL